MKKLTQLINKKISISTIALVVGFSSFSFVDDYFEVSKNLEIFTAAYREVDRSYVDPIEPGKMIRTAIEAMFKTLDPYTNFYSESEIEDFRFMTTGKYGGIGAVIGNIDGKTVVIDPYEGFPAQKSGLLPGDELIEVDGNLVTGKDNDDISKLLKGAPKTKVILSIRKFGSTTTEKITLEREEIALSPVTYSGMINQDVGYVQFESFTEGSAEKIKKAFLDLKSKGMKKFILDLRNNGGGSLEEAINIVGLFVPKNSLVVDTRGRRAEYSQKYYTHNQPTDLEIPIVVLVNENSASASEIVSGCIQDYDRGIVIGARTFGKGLVQTVRPLVYNTQMKVTTAKYYTPSGRCVQEIDYSNGGHVKKDTTNREVFKTNNGRKVYGGGGVTPDIAIKSEEYHDITAYLIEKNIFFKYAAQFRRNEKSIGNAQNFHLSDAQYQSFIDFVLSQKLDFKTETEEKLKDLIASAKKDDYLVRIQNQLDDLEKKLTLEKKSDLTYFKKEIKEVLESEIAFHYYFFKGRVEQRWNDDKALQKGISLLNQPSEFQKILRP
jgi:carboxyl-terminal processing protease